MSRKARANARRRKGKRAATTATATAKRVTPVATAGTQPASGSSAAGASGATATGAWSRQMARSSVAVESSRQTQRDELVRDVEGVIHSTPPTRVSPAVAMAVATAANAAHGGVYQHEHARPAGHRWLLLPISISRAGFTDDLTRQVTIARSIVVSYLRSGWFVAEVAGVAGLFALCFGAPFDAAYLYRIAGLALGLFALIATYALDHAVASPRMYVLRSMRSLGRPTVAPLVLAATITRIVAFILLLSLVLVFRRLTPIEPLTLVTGAVGLVANCALIAAVTVACSTPFARRDMQLGVLTWIVAALATYSPGTIFSSIPIVSWVLRLPLLPFATCYNVGVTGVIGWPVVAALVAEAGMIAAAVALADAGLRRRLGLQSRNVGVMTANGQ